METFERHVQDDLYCREAFGMGATDLALALEAELKKPLPAPYVWEESYPVENVRIYEWKKVYPAQYHYDLCHMDAEMAISFTKWCNTTHACKQFGNDILFTVAYLRLNKLFDIKEIVHYTGIRQNAVSSVMKALERYALIRNVSAYRRMGLWAKKIQYVQNRPHLMSYRPYKHGWYDVVFKDGTKGRAKWMGKGLSMDGQWMGCGGTWSKAGVVKFKTKATIVQKSKK